MSKKTPKKTSVGGNTTQGILQSMEDRSKAAKKKAENSSTEYEGTSLAEEGKKKPSSPVKKSYYGSGYRAPLRSPVKMGEILADPLLKQRAKTKKNPTKPKKKEPSWMREPTKRTSRRSEYRSDSPKNDPWR